MGALPSRRTLGVGLIAFATGWLLAGCGGNGRKSAPPASAAATMTAPTAATGTAATPDKHELAQKYLRIVAPANAALDTFNEKEKSYSSDTRAEQVVSDLAPVISAYQEADNALLRVNWPPSIAADVKALVGANGALIGDLEAADSQDVLSSSSWTTQASQDGGKSVAAANIVRADLGLPAMKF